MRTKWYFSCTINHYCLSNIGWHLRRSYVVDLARGGVGDLICSNAGELLILGGNIYTILLCRYNRASYRGLPCFPTAKRHHSLSRASSYSKSPALVAFLAPSFYDCWGLPIFWFFDFFRLRAWLIFSSYISSSIRNKWPNQLRNFFPILHITNSW